MSERHPNHEELTERIARAVAAAGVSAAEFEAMWPDAEQSLRALHRIASPIEIEEIVFEVTSRKKRDPGTAMAVRAVSRAEQRTAWRRSQLLIADPVAWERFMSETMPSPEEQAAYLERRELMRECLSERERAVIDLRLQGESHEDIAKLHGVSVRTVQRDLDGALARLKERASQPRAPVASNARRPPVASSAPPEPHKSEAPSDGMAATEFAIACKSED